MSNINKYKMLINGEWLDASNKKTFTTLNPSLNQAWSEFPEATEDDVNHAVESAYKALHDSDWAKMTPTQRGHCLRKLGDLLVEQSEKLGIIETNETGKLLQETRWQAKYIAEYYYYYAGCADKIHGKTLPIDKPDMFAYTLRKPLGVIAAVIPWNSQMFLSAVKIGPALAAGNTMIIKLSEHAAGVMLEFGKLIAKAGIPDGVINLVTGHGDPCGRVLTSHPKVARISFTGGTTAAQHVINNSRQNFAEVSLELGGKSPIIVFDDADIESAVNGAVSGIFAASGQSCVAGSRLYLHEDIADDFIAKIIKIAKNIKVGDPLDKNTEMGPLCTRQQLEIIESNIKQATQEGAKILYGAQRVSDKEGLYFQPTLIECTNQTIVDTELFGPVLSVVRFKTETEVVQKANQSKYGLAAGIFTRQNSRAIRMTNALDAGIVWVNTYRVISPIAEFGGMKHSGFGRESGMQAVYDYTKTKTIWINTSDEPLGSQFVAR